MSHSAYYDATHIDAGIAAGLHRDLIGGHWDVLGRHQLDFLIQRGLKPEHRLLDIGCGSLRLGCLAIPYLEPLRYFGTDLSASLVHAGRAHELDDDGRRRAPIDHFAFNDDFDFDFVPEAVDFAIAQSVFTHLPINHLRRCLARLSGRISSGGVFYVTFFECPPQHPIDQPLRQPPGEIITHDYCDPYHYRLGDLAWAIDGGPWRLDAIGDWNHPRGQHIAAFRRL